MKVWQGLVRWLRGERGGPLAPCLPLPMAPVVVPAGSIRLPGRIYPENFETKNSDGIMSPFLVPFPVDGADAAPTPGVALLSVRSLVVTGWVGSGKTVLIEQVVREFLDAHADGEVILVDPKTGPYLPGLLSSSTNQQAGLQHEASPEGRTVQSRVLVLTGEPSDIATSLTWNHFIALTRDPATAPVRLVVVDHALTSDLGAEWEPLWKAVEEVLAEAEQTNTYLVVSESMFDDVSTPAAIREAASAWLHMGGVPGTASAMMEKLLAEDWVAPRNVERLNTFWVPFPRPKGEGWMFRRGKVAHRFLLEPPQFADQSTPGAVANATGTGATCPSRAVA